VKEQVLTASTISLAVSVIGGWLWATSYFMVRSDADAFHVDIRKDVRRAYLELKIDAANTELTFLEREGVAPEEQREYDLQKLLVERMAAQLMELER